VCIINNRTYTCLCAGAAAVVLQVLAAEFDKPYVAQLQGFLQQEWAAGTVYPPKESIFRAFNSVPFDQVGLLKVCGLLLFCVKKMPKESIFRAFNSVPFDQVGLLKLCCLLLFRVIKMPKESIFRALNSVPFDQVGGSICR
jgi:hypothetical protein